MSSRTKCGCARRHPVAVAGDAANGFWRNRPCAITGADGFIGAHLAHRLAAKGAHVIALCHGRNNLSTLALLGTVDRISRVDNFDVSNFGEVRRFFADTRVEFVFHLAALATLQRAAKRPLAAFETSAGGAWNVLEACRHCAGIRAAVLASSAMAYGDNRPPSPHRESTSGLKAAHVYGATKACLDMIGHAYFSQYGLPVCITRCTNIYGPGDLRLSRLIPGTIMRALDGQPAVVCPGQAGVRRDYLYIEDAIDAYLALAEQTSRTYGSSPGTAEKPDRNTWGRCAYNVSGGPRNIETVRGIVKAIAGMTGGKSAVRTRPRRRLGTPAGRPDLLVDSSKITRETGWRPSMALIPDGLSRTVAWYREHLSSLLPLLRQPADS
jgi:CDP-glucose 4,6-dehydratase